MVKVMKLTKLKAKGLQVLPVTSVLSNSGKIHTLQPVMAIAKPDIETYGIKDTLKSVKLIAAIANAVFVVAAGGWMKLGIFSIIFSIIPIVPKLFSAISGIGNVVNELNDLSPNEKEELIEAVKNELMFSEDVEGVVGIALDIIYKIKLLAGVFK